MKLKEYNRKRDFSATSEPRGTQPSRRARDGKGAHGIFAIQKHDATRLHYDFRLEHAGVLWSWAVPKGPSLDPSVKRLAVRTEDHPLDYANFEGVIPEKQYGAGPVIVWDRGHWYPEGDPDKSMKKGRLDFRVEGRKLHGRWVLTRMGREASKENWLLIKRHDDAADAARDLTVESPASIRTGRRIEELKPQPPPEAVGFELCTLVDAPPSGEGWVHEIKFDGYRAALRIDGGRARVITRGGKDWTAKFAEVAEAAGALKVKNALIDGELVVFDGEGRSRFELLQQALSDGGEGDVVYQAFDLLHLDGRDLRALPLLERKAALQQLLGRKKPGLLRYTDHVAGKGAAFYARACEMRIEGIIAKRADSPYRAVRGGDWQKIKCLQRQEFVIGGFTDPGGSRTGFGALLVGVQDDGALRYAGKIGTGFDDATLARLHKRLKAIETDDPPFSAAPRERGAHWVEPALVAEAEFTEWTRDGRLRHPVFLGLREDKPAKSVVREVPVSAKAAARAAKPAPRARTATRSKATRKRAPAKETGEGAARVTNPGKVLDPRSKTTKGELAEYFEAIAPRMLPYVAGRPLAIVRCPNGIGEASGKGARCFFQKHIDGKDIVVEDAAGLVALAQLGAIEVHPWGSSAADLERPDVLVIDLDPGPGVAWKEVIAAAHRLRESFEDADQPCFAKVTGGKGLHVVVPMRKRLDWDEHKALAKAVADRLAEAEPDRFTANMRKSERGGRIFVDYLRNGRGATAIAPYSPRNRPGITLAMPVAWSEVTAKLRPDGFRLREVLAKLRTRGGLGRDPWRGYPVSK